MVCVRRHTRSWCHVMSQCNITRHLTSKWRDLMTSQSHNVMCHNDVTWLWHHIKDCDSRWCHIDIMLARDVTALGDGSLWWFSHRIRLINTDPVLKQKEKNWDHFFGITASHSATSVSKSCENPCWWTTALRFLRFKAALSTLVQRRPVVTGCARRSAQWRKGAAVVYLSYNMGDYYELKWAAAIPVKITLIPCRAAENTAQFACGNT